MFRFLSELSFVGPPLERINKNYGRAAGSKPGGGSSLFGLGLRFASVTAPLAGMRRRPLGYGGQVLLRPRPMIGTTRPRPKILAPRWLQFSFNRARVWSLQIK